MNDVMTEPSSEAPGDPRSNWTDWLESSPLGRFRRSDSDRWLTGVAGGTARYLGIEPWVARLVWVGAGIVGIGLALYILAWLLLPSDSGDSVAARHHWSRNTAIAVVVLAVVLLGFGWDDRPWRWGPMLVVAAGVWLLVRGRPGASAPAPLPAAPPATGVTAPPPPGAGSSTPAAAMPAGTMPLPVAAPPPAPRPASPPRPRHRSLIAPLTLATITVFVGIAIASPDATWNRPVVVAAISMAALGAALIVSAWVGRSRGLIALGMLATGPLLLVAAADDLQEGWGDWTPERTLRPVGSFSERNYERAFGDTLVDLREIDLAGDRTTVVRLDQAAGEVRVLLPDTGTAAIDTRIEVGVGEILLDTADGREERSGFGAQMNRNLGSGEGDPALEIEVDLGAGQVRLVQDDPDAPPAPTPGDSDSRSTTDTSTTSPFTTTTTEGPR